MANFQDILKRAIKIRDAVSEGANTASLVGGVMVDTLYNQNKLKQDIDSIIDSLKDISKSEGSEGIDEITLANYLLRNGYAKKSDIPTSWWGQTKNANNEVKGSLYNVLSLLFSDSEIEITGVANTDTPTESNNKIVTPAYASSNFLSKLTDDATQGFITFLKGLKSNELATFLKGFAVGNNGCGFDKNGNVVVNSIQSLDFDDAIQKGFGMTKDVLGKYNLSLHNLFVWGKAVFNELEIRKLSSVGGNVILSAASSKIVKVEEVYNDSREITGWKCYILSDDGSTATTNGWRMYDQARCQEFNIKAGTYQNVSNRSYWRAVVGVSEEAETIYGVREVVNEDGEVVTEGYDLYDGKKFDWIILSASNRDMSSNDAPADGDTIVLDGHQTFSSDSPNAQYNDMERTNLMLLETTGSVGVPRIVAYANITTFEHTADNEIFVLSPSKVTFVTKFFEFRSAGGDTITLINNKGAWKEGEKYYYYDQVVYDNAYWTCIAKGESEPTTEKPAEGSSVWRKDLEIGEADRIASTEVLYAVVGKNQSPVTQPSDDEFIYSSIGEATADMEPGDYLWSKTTVTYTSGKTTTTYSVSRIGEDGEKGDKGDQGEKGDKGDDAVSYSVVISYGTTYVSSVKAYGLFVRFNKAVNAVTSNVVIGSEGTCDVYIDGTRNDGLSNNFNGGRFDFIDYAAWEEYIKPNSKIRIDWRSDNNVLLASSTYDVAGGEVVAYKNSDDKPSKPTSTDIDSLGGGWRLEPRDGHSGGEMSNVSYGGYSAGNTTSAYTTSVWSDVSEDGYTWKKSPAGLGDYGWALMKVSFLTSADDMQIKVTLKAYSESNFDTINIYALDTEKSDPSSNEGVMHTSGNGVVNDFTYTVAQAGQHFFYVAYAKDASASSYGDYGLFRMEVASSGEVSDVVWMSKAQMMDGQIMLPWSDPVKLNGKDGESAISFRISPNPLVFDTDDNGIVPSGVTKVAEVRVYKGEDDVTKDVTYASSDNGNSSNCSCAVELVSGSNAYIKVSVNGGNVSKQTVTSNGGSTEVSATAGYGRFVFTYNGKSYKGDVPFAVNVSKFTGGMVLTNKEFQTKYSELSNDYNNLPLKDSAALTEYTSTIQQTAREISLSVSQKVANRSNLLVGSGMRKKGEGVLYSDVGYISSDLSHDDNNTFVGTTKASQTYVGLHWVGSSTTQCIHVEKGKKYTLSCWAIASDTNITFVMEAIWQGSAIDNSRPAGYTGPSAGGGGCLVLASLPKANTWQLVTASFTIPSDSEYEWLEIYIFFRSINDDTSTVRIGSPMLEEGDYSGAWGLSERDYDYIGGNLLDNTATFEVAGGKNIEFVNEVKEKAYGDTYNAAYAKTTGSPKDIVQWGTTSGHLTLAYNEDYVFSFWAKGSGQINCYMYKDGNQTIYVDNKETDGAYYADGRITLELEPAWTRYYVHWRIASGNLPNAVMIRALANAEVWIAKPKLEEGAYPTEWTENHDTIVEDGSLANKLYATGIDIKNGEITVTADRTKFQDNNGVTTAMFEDGKIKADLIDADKIVAEGIRTQELEATNLKVTGDSRFGIWAVGKDSTWGPMIVAADSFTINGVEYINGGMQYCPAFIRCGNADWGSYVRVGAQCTEFSNVPSAGEFGGAWFGAAAVDVCNGYDRHGLKLPTNYGYNINYKPTEYIYSKQKGKDSPALAINVQTTASGIGTAIQTNGAIRGVMAPNVKIYSYSQTIGSGICVAVCTTGGITLTMPPYPVEGQVLLVILAISSGNITLASNGDNFNRKNSPLDSINISSAGSMTMLVFDGTYWRYSYLNN